MISVPNKPLPWGVEKEVCGDKTKKPVAWANESLTVVKAAREMWLYNESSFPIPLFK